MMPSPIQRLVEAVEQRDVAAFFDAAAAFFRSQPQAEMQRFTSGPVADFYWDQIRQQLHALVARGALA